MLTEWITLIDQSALAAALRASLWVYPLINVAHILGLALLLGPILILDVRLLVQAGGLPVTSLARVLLPVARGGFALALGSGLLLFIARAADYAFNPLFQVKLGLIALAVINVLLAHRMAFWRHAEASEATTDGTADKTGEQRTGTGRRAPTRAVPAAVCIAAAVSMLSWTSVVVIGRLLGYR